MPVPIASWRTARDVWEVPGRISLFSEHLDAYSETWPSSGSMRNGTVYAPPTLEHPMSDSGSSSLPTPTATLGRGTGMPSASTAAERCLDDAVALLPTPRVQTGGGCGPDTRRATRLGAGGQTLADALLLPTPRATDGTKGGPNQRGSSGDLMLPSAVQALLPTPSTEPSTGNGHARNLGKELRVLPTPRATRGGSATESVYLLDSGGLTGRPSPDGSESSDG